MTRIEELNVLHWYDDEGKWWQIKPNHRNAAKRAMWERHAKYAVQCGEVNGNKVYIPNGNGSYFSIQATGECK